MSSAPPTVPRGATGRADLLRALAVAERDRLVIDDDGEDWLGYLRREEPAPTPLEYALAGTPVSIRRSASAPKTPLRLPFMHCIVERELREPSQQQPQEAESAVPVPPLEAKDLAAPSPVRLVDYEDLVPQARLLPALRRLLGATRPGPLDLGRVADRLAAGELPRRLPRRPERRWHPDLIVLLDFSPRLWPYREDMHRLAERLLGHCGHGGVQLRVLDQGPAGPWSDWLDHQGSRAMQIPRERPWSMPAAGTPVLIAGDLGLLLGAGSGPARAWRAFVATLIGARVCPLALVPLGAGQIGAALRLPILRWSPDAPVRPSRGHGAPSPEPEGLEDLLALVAAAGRRVDPPLLRDLRRLVPRGSLDAGLEGALWCHPDIQAGTAAAIRPEVQARHLDHFNRRLRDLHLSANALRRRHHAHLRAFLNHEETLLWETHADPSAARAFTGDIEAAKEALGRLAATLDRADAASMTHWWELAQGIEGRADEKMARRHQRLLAPLVAARVRWARAFGIEPRVPGWTDPAVLSALLGGDESPTECWLVRDAVSGSLLLQAGSAGTGQSPLGGPLDLDAGGARIQVAGANEVLRHWVWARDLPLALARLDRPVSIRVEAAREAVRVAAVRRPPGTVGWECGEEGIVLHSPPLGSHTMSWSGAPLQAARAAEGGAAGAAWGLEADSVPVADLRPDSAAEIAFGLDGRFGVYADLRIATRDGQASQRLRWIEPGGFLMGSPEDEPEREDREGPQHWVTLTRGYWLADTACTQALWQAVMGANPSGFTGDSERPVENVSWHDVQDFLGKLEALVPGCRALLPTEAQWEYACRAGTQTPFSFGTRITPEQVNYDGDYPYAGGEKGLNRGETVPVKALPPNPWGLYQMHGNVWEWCADGLREYVDEPREDPTGPMSPTEDESRVVRGGSWISGAGGARSAYRDGRLPGARDDYQGFRFSLRSIEPGQGQVAERPGSGGRSAPEETPTRDESGSRRVFDALVPKWLRPDRKK